MIIQQAYINWMFLLLIIILILAFVLTIRYLICRRKYVDDVTTQFMKYLQELDDRLYATKKIKKRKKKKYL